MRKAWIKLHEVTAGTLIERSPNHYQVQYRPDYEGAPISLTMPVREEVYEFSSFPPFFDGLLPEGGQLEGLLRTHKIDKTDYFQQLMVTGSDLVGAVTVGPLPADDE